MSKIFIVTCTYFIKANSKKEAEDYVREESGIDFFERHLIVEENDNDDIDEADIDLTE